MTSPYISFGDREVWNDWEQASDEALLNTENKLRASINTPTDITQSSRANFDKALHSTQIEPPASGLRNLAAWLAVLLVAGAIGAAIVARRGR